jgi:hypothetical protein
MGMPESVSWIEPYRSQYPLIIPRDVWRRIWDSGLRRFALLLFIGVALWIPIIWSIRNYLPEGDAKRFMWFAPRVFVLFLILPIWVYYATALLLRTFHAFCPPFVEVSREGIRVPLNFFPFCNIQRVEVVESGARAKLTFSAGRQRRTCELAPHVDVAALRALLDSRDARAVAPPAVRLDSFWRLQLAIGVTCVAVAGVGYACVLLFGTLITGHWIW